jgi:hypothetical protein
VVENAPGPRPDHVSQEVRGFVLLYRSLIKTAFILPFLTTVGQAQDISLQKVQGPWISSRPYLQEKKPELPEFSIGFIQESKRVLVDSLNSIDQAKAVAKMQSEAGTRSQSFGEGFLTISRDDLKASANNTRETRWTLFRNMRTYAGKEVRLDVVPEAIKSGFRFDFTKKSGASRGPQATPVRYGLILRDIEPSKETYAVAALGADMQLFQQAPRAELVYDIGPLPMIENNARVFSVNLSEPAKQERQWTSYLPDYHFKGKVVSKGRPTLAQPIPKQGLTLEQADGLYNTEIIFANGLRKESIVHRFFIPVYGSMRIAEEYDEQFRPRKVLFTDIYSHGGLSFNIEHHLVEERYQAGLIYNKSNTRLELYAHVPHAALKEDFWVKHRWELAFQTAL